jgi:hypothetical protein
MRMHYPQYGSALLVSEMSDRHLDNTIKVLNKKIADGKRAEMDKSKYILERADRVIKEAERIINETHHTIDGSSKRWIELCPVASGLRTVHADGNREVTRCIGGYHSEGCKACPHYIGQEQHP